MDKKKNGEVTLSDLKLTVATYNSLGRGGIKSIEDLAALTYKDLLWIKNIGEKRAREIVEKAKKFGIDIPIPEEKK